MDNGPVFFIYPADERDPHWRRRVYVQRIRGRVREMVALAVRGYQANFGQQPQYVWVREIPKGAENLMVVADEMILIQAAWVPKGCVCVGV